MTPWPTGGGQGVMVLRISWPIQDRATALRKRSGRLARDGRSVRMDDGKGPACAARSGQTPLSLGYLLDALPLVLAAADGDPATSSEVPRQ